MKDKIIATGIARALTLPQFLALAVTLSTWAWYGIYRLTLWAWRLM
jgi:hypothetical protein